MDDLKDKFNYVYSSSVEKKVQIKIGTLDGKCLKPEYDKLLHNPMLAFSGLYKENCADLIVECQVFSEGRPLALPVTTSYKAFSSRWSWNEWVVLPVMFCDLPRDAQLALTIYDCVGPCKLQPVGGTTVMLFGNHGVFRQGMLDLRVWPDRVADGSSPSSTPGKARSHGKEQMQRLSKLSKRHRNGYLPKVDWLDRLSFREMEVINEREKRSSDFLYLMVEFPQLKHAGNPHSVVYFEPDADNIYPFQTQPEIVTVPDHEILEENLVESKHHKLARSLRSGMSDKDAKPNATVRDHLHNIVAYPPTKVLTTEEQDLVWRFRFYLSNQKKALTKFLLCVNWKLHAEVRQALSMLEMWVPMDVEDALQLLSPQFTHPAVRRYAVSRLQQAPDEDLLLYLLQLVQALKYENFDEINAGYSRVVNSYGSQEEKEAPSVVCECSASSAVDVDLEKSHVASCINISSSSADNLASFLIYRACQNMTLANYFFWYLVTESESHEKEHDGGIYQDNPAREMYCTVKKTFLQTLQRGNKDCQQRRIILARQQIFITELVKLVKMVARESGNRTKKIERLQSLFVDSETFMINFANIEPLPFPLNPDIYIKGIVAESATLFKSALMPSRLTFLTTDNTEYVAIFKHGDDLRQDQLILQSISLMDKLLRRENLDLKLTPYRVLATSTKHGFVQFIDSLPVAEVLASDGSIQNFFRKHHPMESAPYGIQPEIIDNYVRSCAGYCVITYILGVGDRHLDNLLLTSDGKLFHIDFGFILGRDPKPLPPPIKLSKEMVEAMGGTESDHYHEFRKQCYTAFLHLRRHANLILNLFSLMVDASVPDIALEPDKAVKKVQDKLRLDLSDEEAVHYMQTVLDLSVTAVIAVMVEKFHKIAQYWRT
ncbi:phosphatidylinositol 3-kinase catalytic subunit type 3 [Thrips palmi]|uniref:Phosphatidylinositol 3-kinase catalytic subunit type 3 n=1 Tax=Thrips palmi TaxID=161013 RepID=A0A6P8YLT0_THRPL|nr:phosphatidylinositol 3-kinase catalytic subunit type 3 [Thrips palmi]